MRPTTNAELVARLVRRIHVSDTGCWEYRGQRDPKGYGRMANGSGSKVLAHRLAWTLRHVDPGDLCVLHRCDNPPCVRPAHLFLGTRADNNADMDAKGRRRNAGLAGEAHGRARLTESDVAEIRSLYSAGDANQHELARRFGVTQSHIWRIVHCHSWSVAA